MGAKGLLWIIEMKSKICICKEDFRMNNTSVGWNIDFKKNQEYFYTIEEHDYFNCQEKETALLLYFVSDGNITELFKGVPFVEKKFKKYFDNTQEDRNDKLNKILND